MMGARWVCAGVVFIPLMLTAVTSSAADKATAKGDKIEYKTYNSYFVSNKANLQGESTFFVFTDQDALGKVLRPTPPNMRQKREYLPRDVFESKLVVTTIKRGTMMIWEYQVEKVTVDQETLYVQYKVTSKATSANFVSPLILTVNKGKLKKVVFIENGKNVATVEVAK